ncbi:hypothetical protein [Streptomyces sp. S.PNR 29]|uniref:hypothetical protein n=1 Tax=Streptomyces sp. S.PNR 29 TaxID=2973805 RepID=UPI0025B23194|nr:hypothetical protein [Streptomyces sp. S.PNR 29]MDN0194001.1 hypothetical protein [Streptomyces sp. S.PNR 29]
MHDPAAAEHVEAEPVSRRTRTAKQWTAALLGDLWKWVARKPVPLSEGQEPIRHSSDVRMLVWAFVVTDLLAGVLADTMLPPVGRALHVPWMVFTLVLSLGFCAMTARAPHLLDAGTLRLRTGPFREVTLPIEALASVRVAHGSSQGYGLRRVPGDDDAVACTVGSATNLVIELREPLLVPLRKGEPVRARRIHTVADEPGPAARLISRAIAGGGQR